MILSVALASLAGCGHHAGSQAVQAAPDPVAQAVGAGYDAFRAGDRDGLEQAIQALQAQLPADETTGDFVGCGPKRFTLHEIEQARRKLLYLAASPALSMGEAERYVYFQSLAVGDIQTIDQHGHAGLILNTPYDPLNQIGELGGPSDFECQGTPATDAAFNAAKDEDKVIDALGKVRLRAWLTSLRVAYDTQLDARMQNAALELNAAQVRSPPPDWVPSGT